MADDRGHSTEEISALQTFLRGNGRYFGPVDGVWSADLDEALRSYQDSRGLGQSGRLDDATKADIAKVQGNPAGGTDDDVARKVTELYGPGIAILLTNPELGPIIRQAATEGLDELRLEGLLQQTNWWRSKNDAERRWDELNNTDPRTADQRRREENARIWDAGHRLGLGSVLTPTLVQQFTEDFLRFGWSDDQLNDVLVGLAAQLPQGVEPVGMIGTDMAQIKKMGGEFLLNVSDWTARDYATRIAKGELGIEDVNVVFRQQAAERFRNNPALVQAIDRGVTPKVYFRNHVETIASELELAPDTINLVDDPRWSRVMEVPQADGSTRAMSHAELIAYARSQPGWVTTRNGHDQFADLNRAVLETFGAIKR